MKDKISLTLRIPAGLHSNLASYAEAVGVSLNQLILMASHDFLVSRSVQSLRAKIEALENENLRLENENLQWQLNGRD